MASGFDPTRLVTGSMMFKPLLISAIMDHAELYHGDTEIVSARTEGDIHRYTYGDCALRARKLAQALDRLLIMTGDRVGTFAWNGYRHMELYYGVSGSGRICHTINPRLFPDQLRYIVNHAEDQAVFFDLTFLALMKALKPECPGVRHWVCMTDRDHMPADGFEGLLCYEDLIDAEDGAFDWPQFDERTASSLCYTSGTTGNPKGALYTNRSVVLHSYAAALPDSLGISAMDSIMPVVPMFHVNAWGLPYACPLTGAKMVMPGAKLDGASLYNLIEREGVTASAGVPTIWAGLVQYVKAGNLSFSTFRRAVIGGSTCPPSLMEDFAKLGVEVIHAWGMTELSPLGTVARLKAKDLGKSPAEQKRILEKQGRPVSGIKLKIVGGEGKSLPNDGAAFGDLYAQGHWVIDQYFGIPDSPLEQGWFKTGDISTIDPDGNMQIVDRSKDVIKSGGEWISSIELENAASSHADVAMCACIGIAHPKWDERPLLVIVPREGSGKAPEALKAELYEILSAKVAKWWLPDDIVFAEEIPMTATGKLHKLKLRERFGGYVWKAGS